MSIAAPVRVIVDHSLTGPLLLIVGLTGAVFTRVQVAVPVVIYPALSLTRTRLVVVAGSSLNNPVLFMFVRTLRVELSVLHEYARGASPDSLSLPIAIKVQF